MARYKGKRETPKVEKSIPQAENEPLRADDTGAAEQQEPFPVEQEPGLAEEALADPFEEESPQRQKFFQTRTGRIVLVVLCAVLAFAVGGAIAVGSWYKSNVKPPEVPGEEQTAQKDDAQQKTDPATPETPSDEELYPDDGYDGDMPTVSGDRKEGVYTFLLVGTDKGDGNTDTIMVVSYDTVNQDISIMSIPRDTMINESWDLKKINSVYSRTGGSVDALANRVRKLIGFKPDFYVKVDLSMFVKLVDLVGGVEFDVPQDMKYSDPYQDLYIDLKAGVQTLDGEHAMQLVRFRRYAQGDIKRVEVQQAFMKALIKECLSFNNWGKVKAYIELALENVQTDLDFGSVVWFAANVLGMNDAPMLNMDAVYTCTLPGNYYASAWSRSTNSYQSYVTVYANDTVKLVNERFNPYQQNVTTGMLDIMTIQSNGDIASSAGLKDTQHNAIMAVRRGEAYYDSSGKLVYGKKPSETTTDTPASTTTQPSGVQQDASGNYYIVDEAGNTIYTDANGTPLSTEPSGSTTPEQPQEPGTTELPVQTPETETPETETPETETPAEPVPETPGESADGTTDAAAPSGEGETTDGQIPGWLLQ